MNSFWDFFWIVVVSFLFVSYLMVLFHIVADIFRDDSMGGWAKALWVVVLIFLPFLGALIYLIARGPGMAERSMRQVQSYQEQQAQYIRSVAGGSGDPAAQVAQAKQLLDSGAITKQEFDTLKRNALGG
jgi:Phospholipase_D-nuclease N-terminal